MLTLTENASTIIKTITESAEGQEVSGLRISPAEGPQGQELSVTAAAEPEPSDQVVEEQGARVFVEQTTADALDDKVLDAQVDASGAVQFSLAEQAAGEGPPQM